MSDGATGHGADIGRSGPELKASLRVAFAGTPAFAEVALAAIVAAGHAVPLVLTQPDRPAGRGLKLQASAVKSFALARGLPVAQPRGLRLDGRYADDAAAARAALEAVRPDVLVVAAYGLILPAWVLALPRLGCLNVHGSLLPRWRGAAPIHRAIEAGDAATGITIMQMDAGLDTGPMLLEEMIAIAGDDTAASLHDRLAPLGGRLIVEALARAAAGTLWPRVQPAEGVTYAAKIDKSEAAIDWRADAALIERRLRAFDPFPGATAQLDGETIKCWRGEVVERASDGADGRGPVDRAGQADQAGQDDQDDRGKAVAPVPGEVLAVDADGPVVACGRGALRLTELQRPGGRRGPAAAFLAGRPIHAGSHFDPGGPLPSRSP